MERVFDNSLSTNYSVMKNLSGPITVSFDITTKCNLRCLHCYNNSGTNSAQEVSDEEILEIARQIADMHPYNVCLCGGETLCRNNILDIMDILRGNVGRISMVSNGFALKKEVAKKLIEHGLDHIQISLDGADKFQHDTFRGRKGSFEQAVKAIEYLKEYDISRIATSLVPNKLNYKSVKKYMDLCYGLGVDNVRMMPFIPSGRGRTIGRNLMLSDLDYFYFLRDVEEECYLYAGKMQIEWGDPLDHMRRMPYNAYNGLRTYCMEVKANADITVTTYLPIVVGNCRKHSLKEYWDKGYCCIWNDERIIAQVDRIQNIYDFDLFEPAPYSGEKLYYDIISRNPE